MVDYSTPKQKSPSSTHQPPLEFLDQIKEFITSTIALLHHSGAHKFQLLPPTTQKKQQGEPISWDFDSKEHAREKYGNLNTPIVMKLVSKFNKKSQQEPLNSQKVCNEVVVALNSRLRPSARRFSLDGTGEGTDESSPRMKEKQVGNNEEPVCLV